MKYLIEFIKLLKGKLEFLGLLGNNLERGKE
jgi:hypothetical protein